MVCHAGRVSETLKTWPQISPSTGEVTRNWTEHDADEVERRLEQAERQFTQWSTRPLSERCRLLRDAASRLEEARDSLARRMTDEMGKPITQSDAEVEKCAWICEHVAEHAARMLAPEEHPSDGGRSYVRFDPLGVILAVMPWNFPLWQVFRAAAPALAAGNVMVLKHASNVPGCAEAIEGVFASAGFPAGAFTSLRISAARAEALVDRPGIRGVTLTGSEPAGAALAARAGAALKKSVLELGGSDPFVVLASADPEVVADEAVLARIVNTGQSCIAAKRFIVHASVAERFESRMAERMAALRVGDPRERDTEVGPLARQDLVEELDRQVRTSIARGARLLTGGKATDRAGFYYSPTVLADVTPGMAVFDEETFGPVAAVIRARDLDHALSLANQSRFGLGASVWGADASGGEAIAARLEAGMVFVNGRVKSDPRLPFGGIKSSGYGRELATIGIREFVNAKTVWIR